MANSDNIRVMLVEDDEINVRAISHMLDTSGYTLVGHADSADSAIPLFEKCQPDLILVDIMINGDKDGVAFAEEVSQIQPVPVVFITSLTDDESFQRAKETKPYGFINKPFKPSQLRNAVDIAFQNFVLYAQKTGRASSDLPSMSANKVVTPLINDSFFLKIGNKLVKIPIATIRWIEVKDDYCTIVGEEKRYNAKISLKEFANKLPDTDFVRVHRNYIINAQYISNIDIAQYTLHIGEQEIPLTRTYKDDLLKRLQML